MLSFSHFRLAVFLFFATMTWSLNWTMCFVREYDCVLSCCSISSPHESCFYTAPHQHIDRFWLKTKTPLKTFIHFPMNLCNLLVAFMRRINHRFSFAFFPFRLNHSKYMSLRRKYELPSYFCTIEWHCCDNDWIYDKHSTVSIILLLRQNDQLHFLLCTENCV